MGLKSCVVAGRGGCFFYNAVGGAIGGGCVTNEVKIVMSNVVLLDRAARKLEVRERFSR